MHRLWHPLKEERHQGLWPSWNQFQRQRLLQERLNDFLILYFFVFLVIVIIVE